MKPCKRCGLPIPGKSGESPDEHTTSNDCIQFLNQELHRLKRELGESTCKTCGHHPICAYASKLNAVVGFADEQMDWAEEIAVDDEIEIAEILEDGLARTLPRICGHHIRGARVER